MIPAMDEVGKRFECSEYFVPELLDCRPGHEDFAGTDYPSAGRRPAPSPSAAW